MVDTKPIDDSVMGLRERLAAGEAKLGIIGMGYVGLPLGVAALRAGFIVTGFDIDSERVKGLNAGQSPMKTLPDSKIAAIMETGRFHATTDYSEIASVDAVMICVPTPLSYHREPDLSYIKQTGEAIAPYLRSCQLIVLESTTYPGTTQDVLRPILERSGLKAGTDFYLGYAPEREDPGNPDYETSTIPRVIGGDDPASAELCAALYRRIAKNIVLVSSCATAEATKLTENIFRSVNIALVNELKVIFARMGINIWEVIEAAKTKPFGFMPFYPGPGLGGHCIPIDPFYLTWKAREFNVPTRFIELAGEVNAEAPHRVIQVLAETLSLKSRKSVNGANILLLGLAYKKNVDDMRESPSLIIFEELETRGANVSYYDPFIPRIPMTREHSMLAGRCSVAWSPVDFRNFDAALICTDHDGVDYKTLVAEVPLVVDARNATKNLAANRHKIVLA